VCVCAQGRHAIDLLKRAGLAGVAGAPTTAATAVTALNTSATAATAATVAAKLDYFVCDANIPQTEAVEMLVSAGAFFFATKR
jgi:hypothetical protein